jgi:hypothetical protein
VFGEVGSVQSERQFAHEHEHEIPIRRMRSKHDYATLNRRRLTDQTPASKAEQQSGQRLHPSILALLGVAPHASADCAQTFRRHGVYRGGGFGMRRIRVALAALAVLCVTTAAFADNERDKRYIYVFKDDPLHGDELFGGLTIIKVRKDAARVLLIRPRTEFLNELLKSTETL